MLCRPFDSEAASAAAVQDRKRSGAKANLTLSRSACVCVIVLMSLHHDSINQSSYSHWVGGAVVLRCSMDVWIHDIKASLHTHVY